MAYLLLGRQNRGPYPCYAGEYCGNHVEYKFVDETRFRKGRPRQTPFYTSEKLAAMGLVGLYLRRNVSPYPEGFEPTDGPLVYISTPGSLREQLNLTRRQRRKLHAVRHQRHAERRAGRARSK